MGVANERSIAWGIAKACHEQGAELAFTFQGDALAKRVKPIQRAMDTEGWIWPESRWIASDLAGKTLGLVGLGRIGRSMARMAGAFRMRVLAYDVMPQPGLVDLDTILRESDVITLHAPLTDDTRHLINARRLAQMRDDAYLVNCARAGLVDHQALGDALGHGVIAGAAIDVFPHEPPPADEPAFGWPNLIVQPHSAWYSPEASLAPYTRQIEDLARFLRGEEPIGLISQEGGA